MKKTAVAHTNIALIKYWGKRDEKLILPANSSLSLTLDQFYTKTTVEWRTDLDADRFVLDGEELQDAKVTRFMEIIRKQFATQQYASIVSENHVPTAAGLASSASAFAALSAAATAALGYDLSNEELSKLARQGSGSASRSIYGDFAIWEKGALADGSDSFAHPLHSNLTKEIAMVVAVVSDKKKKVSSRVGMKSTVETSPFFTAWIERSAVDLEDMKRALSAGDFVKVGEIAERNAMRMHATTLGAEPPFTYFQPLSLEIMDIVREMRHNGIPAYFTMDAGPNVKVICLRKDEQQIQTRLKEIISQVYICHAGEGVKVVNEDE
ncbi:diphosphomevalonate decarboxylase [Listeria costaricensis]|uniref:diphosphomevalonate decarboxylase n=1 Tax=Listeria costaricensis TaxID=2026604 RepID=UPI000C08AB91|nr:diphosphomevalonate decarboxylase [Listeria costaricensis]